MVFIKIPQNAQPGQIVQLNLHNTFTECTGCGKEIDLHDAYYDVTEEYDYVPDELYCWLCHLERLRNDFIDAIRRTCDSISFFNRRLEDKEDE